MVDVEVAHQNEALRVVWVVLQQLDQEGHCIQRAAKVIHQHQRKVKQGATEVGLNLKSEEENNYKNESIFVTIELAYW